MAVTIRLTRTGRRKRPYYRIVVTDTRAPRDGRYIECLGTYDSMEKPASVKIEEARTNFWLDRGAVPSDTVRSLLRHRGILLKRNLKKRGMDEAKIEEELKNWESVHIERVKRVSPRLGAPGRGAGVRGAGTAAFTVFAYHRDVFCAFLLARRAVTWCLRSVC